MAEMGAAESVERRLIPSGAQPEACSPPSPPDGEAKSITATEDDSTSIGTSWEDVPWSTITLIGSLLAGENEPVGILEKRVVEVRPETRDFYKNLNAFFDLKQIIESIAEKVMPTNAVNEYADIKPLDGILIQECVPQAELQAQLDVLYAHAKEAKLKFDDFGRNLVLQVGLEPDAVMLEQANQTWCAYTAVGPKARDTAMKKALNESEGDARRLVDIVRASVVVNTETEFDAIVKCLNKNYVANERDGVRVVRFKNRCKKPLADGTRDVLYNISIMLNDCSSRFVCELQIHMRQILDYKEATHRLYEYFRSYFKGGDARAVTERVVLLKNFARRDVNDISKIVTSALKTDDEDQLDALDELFYMLSELEIVALIRDKNWIECARRLWLLATALAEQGKCGEAKALIERSLRIQETVLGEHHPIVATSLNNLATLIHDQGKYKEAKPLLERSLRIQETNLGEHHPDVAPSLNNLANLLSDQGKYDEARPLYERSLRIKETSLGEHHPGVAETLTNMALLALDEDHLADAAQQIERATHIFETTLGTAHPHTTKAHRIYADITSRLEAAAQH